MHPTFANHELLWEFVLVQDIEKESVIERCRRKLQNQQEHQMEKEEWWGSSFYGTTGKSRSSSVSNQGSNNSSEKSQKHQSSSSGAKESFNSGRRVSLASSLSSINDEAAKVLNPIKTVTKKYQYLTSSVILQKWQQPSQYQFRQCSTRFFTL